ncbi:MAG TPA: S8 family peptidase [Mycobacteriales bacterium]|nr:S8 family peptidase [Mycobacteriales bacterium]
MSRPVLRPAHRRAVALLGGAGLVIGLVAAIPPSVGAAPADPTGNYIVQLSDLPAASYAGSVPGYRATRPAKGARLNPRTADVRKYSGYLKARHANLAAHAGNVRRLYDYTLSFNGFAASMPASAATKLAHTPGVVAVTKDEQRRVDTVSTPAFLGLTKDGGLWDQLGGTGRRGAGKGMVVGMVDSGIWPENPSFAPLKNPDDVLGWHGTCQPGEQWDTTTDCNTKIIGARWYDAGQGGDAAIRQKFPDEVLSARDMDGHGTHTAGTAAGNYGVPFVVNGTNLGAGSGMAPNARLAVYKVCWSNSCSTADSMKAIEDATNDGVDVINFSISGSLTSMVDPVELQFLFAADAGIFVAASAGNSGPGASTVAHNDPWVTTVAASTHDRVFQASVTLGNGATYPGAGLGTAVPSSPVVLSTNAGLAPSPTPAEATGVRLCFSSTWTAGHGPYLDPAKIAGKIVVCDRGTNDRTDKSKAVQEAGGVGMILANTSPNSLNADFHAVPTVHVSDVNGAAIKAYVSGTASPTAALAAGVKVSGAQAPFVASFSSRGPALAGNGDLLKPDILAPGVDVLAPIGNPAKHGGRSFDFLSGTSMSSPHIAGIAALIMQAHPTWSPMMVKSALLTTATQRDNRGLPIGTDTGGPAGPFDYGSGLVVPNSATDPGLVYDTDFADWIRFLCSAGQLSLGSGACKTYGSYADPSELNTANIAIGDLAGSQSVTRQVYNVGGRGRYVARVDAPPGIKVTVSPSVLRIGAGDYANYTVTVTRTGAPLNTFATGALTWSDGRHSVRSQLVVRPVGVAAPASVSGTGPTGSTTVSVKPGFTGTLSTSVAGLVAATPRPATLTAPSGTGFDTANPAASDHTAKFTVNVPAGTTLARFATFDADVPAGTDMDVFVYRAGTATLVGQSAGATAQEQVDLNSPAAGDYDVYVDLFALAAGVTSQAVTEYDWALGSTAAGNLTVAPSSTPVTLGKPVSLTASWSGLTAGGRYLGRLSYSDGTTTLGHTVVRVDG